MATGNSVTNDLVTGGLVTNGVTNGHTNKFVKAETIKEINGVTNGNRTNEKEWTPSSWRTKPVKQAVVYEDKEHLQRVLGKLQHLPPMVTPAEVFSLLNSI